MRPACSLASKICFCLQNHAPFSGGCANCGADNLLGSVTSLEPAAWILTLASMCPGDSGLSQSMQVKPLLLPGTQCSVLMSSNIMTQALGCLMPDRIRPEVTR